MVNSSYLDRDCSSQVKALQISVEALFLVVSALTRLLSMTLKYMKILKGILINMLIINIVFTSILLGIAFNSWSLILLNVESSTCLLSI